MMPMILEEISDRGHPVFDGQYDLNIFGIRKQDGRPDEFDDVIGCAYRNMHEWRVHYWDATTDPGLYYLEHPPGSVSGTAILCPGHYPGIWEIDLHQGRYEALCQRSGPVKVWRDVDRDREFDFGGDTDTGFFGINLHKSSGSSKVGKASAGCQVLRNQSDFKTLMKLANLQIATIGAKTFSYTLLEEW